MEKSRVNVDSYNNKFLQKFKVNLLKSIDDFSNLNKNLSPQKSIYLKNLTVITFRYIFTQTISVEVVQDHDSSGTPRES